MPWTHFYDTYQKPCEKERKRHIFINRARAVATELATSALGVDPEEIDCACCERRYVVAEHPTLEIATRFWRRAMGLSLEDFIAHHEVVIWESGQAGGLKAEVRASRGCGSAPAVSGCPD